MQLVPFLKEIYTNAENTRQVTPGGVKASSRGFSQLFNFNITSHFHSLNCTTKWSSPSSTLGNLPISATFFYLRFLSLELEV